jgi:ABC-type uncharacterized transport system involved in gliding motility auxiliary subunit
MMNSKMMFSGKGLVITGAFLLVSVALISVFPRLRVDLTQDSLYTLADGTRNIVRNLEKPVELLFFYSEEATADVHSCAPMAPAYRSCCRKWRSPARAT